MYFFANQTMTVEILGFPTTPVCVITLMNLCDVSHELKSWRFCAVLSRSVDKCRSNTGIMGRDEFVRRYLYGSLLRLCLNHLY